MGLTYNLFLVFNTNNRPMLSFANFIPIRNFHRAINKLGIYWCSSAAHQKHILNSQFHLHGIKHFPKSKGTNRQPTTIIFQIDKLITELEKQRIKIKEIKDMQNLRSEQQLIANGHCAKYFDLYTKMQKRIEELRINEEWGYRLVGWYNFQSHLETLINELLDKTNKTDHNALIESLSWMKPHQLIINTQDSVQELIKQKAKIDNFYKQLAIGHSIQTLKDVESIFQQAVTNSKGKYYHHYLESNLDCILSDALKSDQNLKNLLWVFEMYVVNFNDDAQIINKIENFCIRSKLLTNQDVLKTFIKIYNQMGRANQEIYNPYIRQHILRAPSNIIEIQILNLQFLIHSEVNDQKALNEILKNIAKLSRSNMMQSGHKLHVHYLLHYLKVKNMKFAFPYQFFREYSEICRTFEEDGTFAKTIAVELDEKSRRQGVQYYNSSCVLKKKEIDAQKKKKNQGRPIQKAEGFKKYKDVKFCCLNIDFCVMDQKNKKGVVLQKNYHRFSQSGRLIRMEEVKAAILQHYGLSINYLETKSEISRKQQQ